MCGVDSEYVGFQGPVLDLYIVPESTSPSFSVSFTRKSLFLTVFLVQGPYNSSSDPPLPASVPLAQAVWVPTLLLQPRSCHLSGHEDSHPDGPV